MAGAGYDRRLGILLKGDRGFLQVDRGPQGHEQVHADDARDRPPILGDYRPVEQHAQYVLGGNLQAPQAGKPEVHRIDHDRRRRS
jgi:hypothetical protein